MKVLFSVLIFLLLSLATPVMADGDAAHGEELATMCAACHGVDGNSSMPMWPKLAGQHEAYLSRQLQLIKDGLRSVPEMAGIATILSEQDMSDVSAYFAAQTSKAAVADPALVSLGEKIYRSGNAKTETPACMACHGPAGAGNPLAGYPALAGQHATYLGKMLSAFKNGTSWGEGDSQSKVMVEVASRMTEDEITAVSSYIQGLYSNQAE